MKLYKYRDFSNPNEEEFRRFAEILRHVSFWCAAPSELNDPSEFVWECDFTPTRHTAALLAEHLIQTGKSHVEAKRIALLGTYTVDNLKYTATPLFQKSINHCRSEVGLACFGSPLSNHELMWQRYGGAGAGICIEIEISERLVGRDVFWVKYSQSKILHIDQLLGFLLDRSKLQEIFNVALLSKPEIWTPEAELRFVSKQQNVMVNLDDSTITGIYLGSALGENTKQKILRIISDATQPPPLALNPDELR